MPSMPELPSHNKDLHKIPVVEIGALPDALFKANISHPTVAGNIVCLCFTVMYLIGHCLLL